MGIYDRPYYRDEPRTPGLQLRWPESAVGSLIVINGLAYLAILMFECSDLLAVQPLVAVKPWLWWKFLTSGFAHDPNTWTHLVFNMLALFFFGRDVEAIYGRKRFWHAYLLALLAGSVIWTVSSYVTAVRRGQGFEHSMLGASGAISAIFVLFCIHYPRRTVLVMGILPAPAWLLGVIYLLRDLQGYMGQGGQGVQVAYLVHLVGAAAGGLYYRYGRDIEELFASLTGGLGRLTTGRNLRVYRGADDVDRLAEDADRILAKMHREGEASLTAAERRILESYSRHMREKRR